MMYASKEATISHVKALAGYCYRIDTEVESGKFSLDNVEAIGELEALGRAKADECFSEIKGKFFSRLKKDKTTLSSEVKPTTKKKAITKKTGTLKKKGTAKKKVATKKSAVA